MYNSTDVLVNVQCMNTVTVDDVNSVKHYMSTETDELDRWDVSK